MIGEPFQRVAHAAAVHSTGADATEGVPEIQRMQVARRPRSDPAKADQDAADTDDQTRTKTIDEVALERHQPGFAKDECGESHLDGSQGCVHAFR